MEGGPSDGCPGTVRLVAPTKGPFAPTRPSRAKSRLAALPGPTSLIPSARSLVARPERPEATVTSACYVPQHLNIISTVCDTVVRKHS